MTELDQAMRTLLLDGGFSFVHPSVAVAWASFKQFAVAPLPGVAPYCVGYECMHEDDRDDVLWLEFARRFDPSSSIPDCGCLFSCPVPKELRGIHESNWWWPDQSTFSRWVLEVEATRSFKASMHITEWRWEGFTA